MLSLALTISAALGMFALVISGSRQRIEAEVARPLKIENHISNVKY
ncbi:MAG: hypothetical protein ACHP79_19890 [Terriglobales bacterium]